MKKKKQNEKLWKIIYIKHKIKNKNKNICIEITKWLREKVIL